MPSLFIGLGPRRDVTEEDLRARVEEIAPITGIRMRGTCAFVDIASDSDCAKVIEKLNNIYINESRLSVQWSKDTRRGRDGRRDQARDRRHRSRSRSRSRSLSRSRSSRSSSRSRSDSKEKKHRKHHHHHHHHRDKSAEAEQVDRKRQRSPSESPSD